MSVVTKSDRMMHLLRRATRRFPAITVVLLTAILVLVAFLHRGIEVTELDVDDGGIWVAKGADLSLGHLNYDALTFDGFVSTPSAQVALGQDGRTVTIGDETTHSVASVDVAAMKLGGASTVPEGSRVVQGASTIAVLDSLAGYLWVGEANRPDAIKYEDTSAIADGLAGGIVTVSTGGTVFAYAPQYATLTTVTRAGSTWSTTKATLSGMSVGDDLSITAVGDKPVIYDATTNTLVLPGGRTRALDADGVAPGAVLQMPGPASSSVLLATPDSLVSVPLNGSAPTVTPAQEGTSISGTPAPPAFHQGCAYGAWSSSGAALRQCESGLTRYTNVERLAASKHPLFRVNRTRIVLNDIEDGTVWLPERDMIMIDTWDEDNPDESQSSSEDQNPDLLEEISDPKRDQKNTPPTAVDDEFGVRPGKSTLLPVLQNDSDSDGDVLTAEPMSQPSFGSVVVTRGGRALQITGVADDAEGSSSFTYSASDGLASATANVSLRVHPWSENAGPKRVHDASVKLGAGAQIEYNVLADWIDPDGDQIFLERAEGSEGLSVQFSEDGTVSIHDLGGGPGPRQVTLSVSDGWITTEGELTVLVQENGNIAPIANADFYVTRVSEPLIVAPLANDTDPNGDVLALTKVSTAPASTTLVPDLELGTVTFTASQVGSYEFTYTVSDGPEAVVGVVRVDVVSGDEHAAPVAEDDIAILPSGGSALVAPLANDTDPSGGVLVVQSIEVDSDSGIEVALIDRHLLRVTAPAGLDDVARFTYTVSNGSGSATASVAVIPTLAKDDRAPLELQNDSAKVRVGDIASIPVLANDHSPSGLAMSVSSTLSGTVDSVYGHAFVTGNLVRFEALDTTGRVDVTYTVTDSAGNTASAVASFNVIGADQANSAPQPKALTAWASAGQTMRIPVPLNGIDPDGDSVTLVGIDQPPTMGTATLGTEWIEYTPGENASGTDVFTYTVEDRLGRQAKARVRVGVAPPSELNHNPVALPDVIKARPSRTVEVNVLSNDVDPDGDTLKLREGSLESSNDQVSATVVSPTSVSITTPAQTNPFVVTYVVEDGRGGSATGQLTVNVETDAPLMAPIARDDVVSLSDVPRDGAPVSVNVLANDEDPDGSLADLSIASNADGVSVDNTAHTVTVTPETDRRLVVYSITDQDGLSSSAVVSVPGAQRKVPAVNPSRIPIRLKAGETKTLTLDDYVLVKRDAHAYIRDTSTVRGGAGLTNLNADESSISFTVEASYVGKTYINVEVFDGREGDDSATSASLTLPIQVEATQNHPPTITPTVIRVASGEETTVDLPLMVSDPDTPDPASFTYRVSDIPSGITVTQSSDTQLRVSAAAGTKSGTAGSLTLSVDDGSGAAVSAKVPIEVVASTRPLIQTSLAQIIADAGSTVNVDLTQYTTNPFPDTPITIQRATVEVGEGTVDPQGTVLAVSPRAGFHGNMVIVYRVMDKTLESSRTVEGRVSVTVRDRPNAPENVHATATGPGRASVSFTPGADNGARITEYLVTSSHGGTTKCEQTVCDVSGLTNGERHSFTVVARNAVGDSDASAPSSEVLVDVTPERMSTPSLSPGDGSLDVTWSAPNNEGSPITSYEITLNGSDGSTHQESAGAGLTKTTVSNLENGVTYYVSIVARNSAEKQAEWSEKATGTPHGKPDTPSNVGLEHVGSSRDGSTGSVVISWSLGKSGGSDWGPTTVTVDKKSKTVDGGTTSVQFDGVSASSSLTVNVDVSNAEGDHASSGDKSFSLLTVPMPISAPRLEGTGHAGQLRVSGLSKAAGNGFSSSELTLRYASTSDGCSSGSEISDGAVIEGNGISARTYYFCQVGTATSGTPVSSSPVSAQGQPTAPPNVSGVTIAKAGPGAVTVNVAVAEAYPAITSMTVTVGGKTVTMTGRTSETVTGLTEGASVSAHVVAKNSEGEASADSTSTTTELSVSPTWVETCSPDVATQVPGGQTCHTFSLSAPGYVSDVSVPHVCQVSSDVDPARQYSVVVDGPSVESGVATLAGSQIAMRGKVVVHSCEPRR